MSSLSVVIIAKNEEAIIDRCLRSVTFADEIVLVDSHSTDRTVEVAESYGAVIATVDWQGYGHAKRYGVSLAKSEWVLNLDADEALTDDLAAEIKEIVNDQGSSSGYDFPRRTWFLNRWIYHCGWYPDRVLRLFRKADGNFNEAKVHESVQVTGDVGHCNAELLHYSFMHFDKYMEKFGRYTTMGAETAFEKGKRTGVFDLTIRPTASFFTHYFVRQGFRDGAEGFIISVMSAVSVFVKYAKLRQLAKEKKVDSI